MWRTVFLRSLVWHTSINLFLGHLGQAFSYGFIKIINSPTVAGHLQRPVPARLNFSFYLACTCHFYYTQVAILAPNVVPVEVKFFILLYFFSFPIFTFHSLFLLIGESMKLLPILYFQIVFTIPSPYFIIVFQHYYPFTSSHQSSIIFSGSFEIPCAILVWGSFTHWPSHFVHSS